LNIKRLAYEVSPVVSRWDRPGARGGNGQVQTAPRLPSAPPKPPPPAGISAEALSRRIDQFLAARGYQGQTRSQTAGPTAGQAGSQTAAPAPNQGPLDFVCEDDVRQAIQSGRKIVVSERAIVTPAARDLGEQHRVFTIAPWRG